MIACDERDIEKERAKRFGLHRSPNTNTGKLPSELAPPVASPFVGSLNVIKLFHRTLNYEIKKKHYGMICDVARSCSGRIQENSNSKTTKNTHTSN